MTGLANESRAELMGDFDRLADLLSDSQLTKLEDHPMLLRPFFGNAIEETVDLKRMNIPELESLTWTGKSNKPQDWFDSDGFGFDLTGNSQSSILLHQNRPEVNSVITYESLTNEEIFRFHKWLIGE